MGQSLLYTIYILQYITPQTDKRTTLKKLPRVTLAHLSYAVGCVISADKQCNFSPTVM